MKYILSLFVLLLSQGASAHVKWFSNYDFHEAPLQLTNLLTPAFIGLFVLSVVFMTLMVYLDKLADKSTLYNNVNGFLDRYADSASLIMRVAMGAVLLMSWQGDSVIAPELHITSPFWGWFQFLLALCLLFKETSPLTGIGIVFLYLLGISEHGFFHMLDYVVYPAVGLYLIFTHSKNERLKHLDLPVLYSGLGFSLCWVAFEKLIYPYWGLSVLAKAPALTMGLPHDFFLMACAFVEFSLGYLLIICLLHRPLAIVITLVFFITTSFFGKTEVVGHTILHGALLVFIVKGPGHYYMAPIRYHKKIWLRCLFAAVNFVILFFILAIPYQKMANYAYEEGKIKRAQMAHPEYHVPAGSAVPSVMLHAAQDKNGGWNLHVMTENFKFTPENSGSDDILGEGHAHLFLNGKKIARIYSNWYHVSLPKGVNKVKINLTTNSHKDYFYDGKPIESEIELDESRENTAGHQH